MNYFFMICFSLALIIAVILGLYLLKLIRFSKGIYGKQTVRSILKRFARTRKFKVLENVQLEFEGQTQTIDFVLVGFFGLIFVTALQGQGDFYGDFKESRWIFAEEDKKITFDNPVIGMDKKLELFRRLASKNKIYNLKIDTAVVVASTKSKVPMYLNNVRGENIVMTVPQFKKMLTQEKYEQDNNVNIDAVCDMLQNSHQ